jgi:hypothetical protein
LVVSVDFGTAFTGVAYCFVTEEGRADDIDIISTWPGLANKQMPRIPTVLYYDALQKLVGWGPHDLDALDGTGCPKDGIQKSEWFVIHLLREETGYHSPGTYLPPLPTGKSAVDLVADYLSHLGAAIRTGLFLKFKASYIQLESQIEWCFTIPPGAGNTFTTAYRSAVLRAGYVKDDEMLNLSFMNGLEACLASASRTGLIKPPPLHNAVLVVNCGAVCTDLMAFEMSNDKHLTFCKLTGNTGDSCG